MDITEIVRQLNLKRSGRTWRGTCPACGYRAAFSLSIRRDGRPIGWCASCQDRDAITRAISGETLPRLTPTDSAHDADAKVRSTDRAITLWNGSQPAIGTLAETYLTGRGLANLAASGAIRFGVDTWHPNRKRYPAMIALVSDIAGEPIAVQRTYLTHDGRKAKVDPVRATIGPYWGGMIRLHEHEPNRPLVIGEGTESSASAGRLMGLPAWAAVSAGNLAKGLVLPPHVRRIVIAADPDQPGCDAARYAWIRWTAEGREVRIATPDGVGDFNDLLVARRGTNAR